MNAAEESMVALDEAVAVAGGVGALAGRIGVTASVVSMWKKRLSVPAEYCPAIERETGVRCERLRPGVAWGVLRSQGARSDFGTPDGAPLGQGA